MRKWFRNNIFNAGMLKVNAKTTLNQLAENLAKVMRDGVFKLFRNLDRPTTHTLEHRVSHNLVSHYNRPELSWRDPWKNVSSLIVLCVHFLRYYRLTHFAPVRPARAVVLKRAHTAGQMKTFHQSCVSHKYYTNLDYFFKST